ncbi:exonuclease SbcC [gut metagenome]|uniref:Exonuclease SbcC n=1 Tax=gut metagenome TaxID=749906 RepID=J9D259_9ZZZZ
MKATALQGQKTQAQTTLRTLQSRALTTDNSLTLSNQVRDSEARFLEKTRLLATLRASLLQDDQKRRENAQQLQAIEAQKTVCARWDRLRQLIGSADGKTFRTAAQKITFRLLLDYANEAMNTMTNRYWLHASGQGGLSIDVIDNDMGGQMRTAKNLSGGESFLVSLALALGLSRMGSRHLRVDTLFLDEGFGTLDDATLNQALYALENLQAASGKLIGIISHVNSIKERIATHITVSQRAGSGVSTLSGPGVTRLPS